MVDENEDILVQKQEEQRQFPQPFARRLHQVGKRSEFVLKYKYGESFQREKYFLRICVAHSMKCCKLHNVDGQFCSWKIAGDYTCVHCLAWVSLQILYFSYGFWKIEKLRPKILFPKMW